MSSLKDSFGGVLKTNPHFSATVNNKPTIFKLLQCNYALKLLTLNSCLQNMRVEADAHCGMVQEDKHIKKRNIPQ